MKTHLLALIAALFIGLLPVKGADVYVSPSGNDNAEGTVSAPLKTIRMALRHARELRRLNDSSIKGGITIHVKGGIYQLHEPLYIRPEDSGTKDSPTIIKAEGHDAVVSGGVQVKGWKRQGKLLVAETPMFNGNDIDFRQLYVGGKKADRARDVADFEQMAHILSLDNSIETLYVPATPAIRAIARQGVNKAEMILHEMWCVSVLRIKDIIVRGDSAAVTFHQPESTIQFEHPWPRPMVNTKPFITDDGRTLNLNSAFYLTNHKALLDKPGEWYHDTRSHLIYYYPRTQEEAQRLLNSSTKFEEGCIVPALETLVEVSGTTDLTVHDVHFEGIRFEHSTWMRPSTDGHVPLQAGMYLLEAYKLRPSQVRSDRNHKLDNQGWVGRPASAIVVRNADDIVFNACTFQHLGSSALDYEEGTHHGIISNNIFTDIAGNGIVAGTFSPEAFESHLPYLPYDNRIVCDGLTIANNLIDGVTNEDWGCVGICCGCISNATIAHNEINHVSYTGISLGWCWNQSANCMRGNEVYRNYIHNYAAHMYDVAGIYTLSAQPKTYITENMVDSICRPSYVHDPNHWFYLYCDEGSSFITVSDNWTPSEKYLRNANGPGNTWENNGPDVNDSIRANAGRKANLDIPTLRQRIQIRKPQN